MLLAVIFVVFGACVVSSNPVKSSNSNLIQESKADFEWQDYFLTREERREKKCRYKGKRYPQGATIDRPVTPDYAHCERCTCVGRKFKNCKKIYHCELGYLPCGKEDYEFLPGECCPVCKQKACREDRKIGDQWQRIKEVTAESPMKGICSLCRCTEDRKEDCVNHNFECHKIPGCLETEVKPDSCCPQCKTWAKPTTEIWFTVPQITESTEPPFTFPFRDAPEEGQLEGENDVD